MSTAPKRERESDHSRAHAGRSRASDDTSTMERPSMDVYSPPNALEVPPARDGYRHRWVAESVNGTPLTSNVQRALREGYSRVLISDLPEDFIVDEDIKGDGVARHGGLMLMKISDEKAKARQRYYRQKTLDGQQASNTLQGIPHRDAVVEDGSKRLTGAEIRNSI